MAEMSSLRERAIIIRDETDLGENTAQRVGGLLYDIVDAISAGGSVASMSVAATVDNSTGTPSVSVVKSGTAASPVFTLNFKSLKGVKGDTGNTGPQGPQGLRGEQGERGERGPQGDPGKDVDEGTIQRIAELEQELSDLMGSLSSDIQSRVEATFRDAEWLEELLPTGQGGVSNFGQKLDSYMDKYNQTIGMWSNVSGQKVYKWSTLEQSYNTLAGRVAAIEASGATPGSYDELIAEVIQSIKDDQAFTELLTQYAKVTDVNGIKTVIEWLYSGLRSSTSSDKSYNEIVSAGKSGLTGAISNLRTYVEKLANGDYVAKANLTAALTDKDNKVLKDAGVLLEANLDSALNTLFAKDGSSIASLSLMANKLGSVISVNADNIVLSGKTWADIIDFDQLMSSTFNGWSGNTIGISTEAITITGSDAGIKSGWGTSITPGEIVLSSGQSNVKNYGTFSASGLHLIGASAPFEITGSVQQGLVLTAQDGYPVDILTVTGSSSFKGDIKAYTINVGQYKTTLSGIVGDIVGVQRTTFTTNDGKTVTVTNGLITNVAN